MEVINPEIVNKHAMSACQEVKPIFPHISVIADYSHQVTLIPNICLRREISNRIYCVFCVFCLYGYWQNFPNHHFLSGILCESVEIYYVLPLKTDGSMKECEIKHHQPLPTLLIFNDSISKTIAAIIQRV